MEVELRGITKRFPGVVANSSVDLSVKSGEVHALLGENGAGKSTLMNILFGLYEPDQGRIVIDGEQVRFRSPADAIAAGIGMVHQHFMLVPVFSVTENVMLGSETTGPAGVLDHARARRRLLELSDGYGLEVDPDAVVEDLPVGIQQRVEILKALYRKADCLILDEPTAVLTPRESDQLFGVIRGLAASGRSIIFISHKLKEVLDVADRITVLREGAVVATIAAERANEQELASLMVGRDVELEVTKTAAQPGDPVLEARALEVFDDRGHKAVDGVSLQVHAGEIVAIAGVQGNGQTELVEAITGLREIVAGEVMLDGRDVTGQSARALFSAGVAHVPEDRQEDGLVLSFPVRDNVVLNTYRQPPFAKGIAVDRSAVERHAQALVSDFDVRTPSLDAPVTNLSGGNQQKLIVAREFSHASRLLVASQPTRGLDVGSIQYIHERIIQKRDEGSAVLIVSSELDEVMALADRIAVIYRGRIVAMLERQAATRERIGLLMAGASE